MNVRNFRVLIFSRTFPPQYPKPLNDNAQLLSQASGQEEIHPCQCINVQYNRHWKLFKTLVGIVLIFVAIFSLILTEVKCNCIEWP